MQLRTALFCLVLTAAHSMQVEAGSNHFLLVLSKGDHTLAIVDVGSGKVVARMPSGPDPHEVVASPDGKLAYISNYGGGAYNTLTPVDLVGHKTLPVIDLGALRGPHGLDYEGGKLWFTAEAAKVIGRIDPATQKVDWILGTGQDRTHMVYVTKDLKEIYTTNVSSGTVTLIEETLPKGPPPGGPGGRASTAPPPPGGQRKEWEETVVQVGKGDEGFDVSPVGNELWAANAWDGTISVIDIAEKMVTATLPADVRGANRLKFTPDGKQVLVSCLGGPNLVVLDAVSKKVIKRITVGRGAAGIQMQPDGALAYVACTPDNYVAIVDLKKLEVTGHIDAGPGPDGMAWVTVE